MIGVTFGTVVRSTRLTDMAIGRRTFLRVAGVSAVGAAAAACSSPKGGGGGVATVTAAPPATSSAAPPSGPPDWAALRGKVSGGLLMPGDSGYEQAKRVFNPLFDTRKPAAVARCASPEDVRACVLGAASRVPIAARSGGHSYAGYSVPDGGLVVDVGPMSKVDVRGDGTAVVGAGTRLKDVYSALEAAGRCLPAGTCPSVGIAGLTLGGGIGVLTRKYGLTCDHLVSAQIVTADGELRTAAADSEPDLFWALRGGGGGNFGIVTSFTFSTEPAPDLSVFSLRFPAGSAAAVLDAWQQWLPGTQPELWSNLVLSGGSPAQCRVGGCFAGGTAALTPLLNDLVTKAGVQPSSRLVQAKSYSATMQYFAGSESRQTFAASSRIMSEPVADSAKLVAVMNGRQGVDLLIDGLGGAVSNLAPADTAFWHRKALASVQIYSQATAGTQAASAKTVSAIAAGLAGIGVGGGYVNYLDPALPDWMNAYYGGNVKRLREVARTYDPGKVFAFAQAITPA
jgi:FAD/FMN-containing dehydrogenase